MLFRTSHEDPTAKLLLMQPPQTHKTEAWHHVDLHKFTEI